MSVDNSGREASSGHDGDAAASSDAFFAHVAHSVDRECRRLGYPAVVRRRRRRQRKPAATSTGGNNNVPTGEYVCVPALLQNCASLLTLLEAGPSWPPPPLPPPLPPPSSTSASTRAASVTPLETPRIATFASSCDEDHAENAVSNASNCLVATAAAVPAVASTSVSTNGENKQSHSRRLGWAKKLFSRRQQPAIEADKAKHADASEAMSAADDNARSQSSTENYCKSDAARKEETNFHLQQLLSGVRREVERLAGHQDAGAEDSEERIAKRLAFTGLQREVLYFQTRWPGVAKTLADRLTAAERTASRLQAAATARAKADVEAKARGAARLASLEAKLRHLRSELRRCGHRPQQQQQQQQQRRLQQPQQRKATKQHTQSEQPPPQPQTQQQQLRRSPTLQAIAAGDEFAQIAGVGCGWSERGTADAE